MATHVPNKGRTHTQYHILPSYFIACSSMQLYHILWFIYSPHVVEIGYQRKRELVKNPKFGNFLKKGYCRRESWVWRYHKCSVRHEKSNEFFVIPLYSFLYFIQGSEKITCRFILSPWIEVSTYKKRTHQREF